MNRGNQTEKVILRMVMTRTTFLVRIPINGSVYMWLQRVVPFFTSLEAKYLLFVSYIKLLNAVDGVFSGSFLHAAKKLSLLFLSILIIMHVSWFFFISVLWGCF